MRKQFLSCLLAILLCVNLITPAKAASAPTFSDVPRNHWAYEAIETMAAQGVIKGVGNGRFNPNGSVTRVQFAAMMARLFYADLYTGAIHGANWWAEDMYIANSAGLMENTPIDDMYMTTSGTGYYSDPTVLEVPISREEMAQVMYNYLAAETALPSSSSVSSARAKIPDYKSVSSKYQTAVATVYALGYLTGVDKTGRFSGAGILTRAEAATVLFRMSTSPDGPDSDIQNDPITIPDSIEEPSPRTWEGWQGRAYAAWVDGEQDMHTEIAKVMDQYPKTIIFFSKNDLSDINPETLVKGYDITHGLQLRIKSIGYDIAFFEPASKAGAYRRSLGEYYEYRLTLFYSAAGLVRMYREGVIDSLPNQMEFVTSTPADYTLLLNTVEEIEREYGITQRSSDYDKAFAAYNWITGTISYDYYMAGLSGNDLSNYVGSVLYPAEINFAIKNHKGVCFEYALTFQALCYIFGLDCYVVTGFAGENHAWNIVKINGQWYQADSTWDAGKAPDNYNYFLVSDKAMASRTYDSGFYDYPACPRSYSE